MTATETEPRSPETLWADAVHAINLFCVDRLGLGGLIVRSPAGPVRDRLMAVLSECNSTELPLRRVPASVDEDRLIGGLDLSATLKAGRPIGQSGLLAEADGGFLLVPMGERLGAGAAVHIAQAMDQGCVVVARNGLNERRAAEFGLVLFDESDVDEEGTPAILAERTAFHIDLREIGVRNAVSAGAARDQIGKASKRLSKMRPLSDTQIESIVALAAALGINGMTAPLFAMRAARASAALAGRTQIGPEDLESAVRLVLAPRALQWPQSDEPQEETPEESEPTDLSETEQADSETEQPPVLDEVLVAAAAAALPAGLLDGNTRRKAGGGAANRRRGAGMLEKSVRRGKPIGVRPGALAHGARLNLVATLQTAAPWQKLRQQDQDDNRAHRNLIRVLPDDFRIQRFAQRRVTSTVFCVDASGSSAFHRLAEAKGAVELLLSEAYVSRAHAALVAFRGTEAEVLLPPTRSLARAKSCLANLPGGGGTPLAAGLETARAIALGERRQGRDPTIVVLTDGQANIARDGTVDRARAHEEALASAQMIDADGLPAIFVDTAPRPRPQGKELSAAMGASYVPLPYPHADAVRDAVNIAASYESAA